MKGFWICCGDVYGGAIIFLVSFLMHKNKDVWLFNDVNRFISFTLLVISLNYVQGWCVMSGETKRSNSLVVAALAFAVLGARAA